MWLEEKLVDALFFCWQIDECLLSSLVLGLVRQCSYSFLEYLEESAITAIKIVIKVSVRKYIEYYLARRTYECAKLNSSRKGKIILAF